MKRGFMLMAAVFAAAVCPLLAQAPPSPEEQEKQMYEVIDKEVERLGTMLDLADWQVFRIDSTLTHDYRAMTEEIMALRMSKVSAGTAYVAVQDKWQEATYQSYLRILNEDQKAKYLKSGAAKAKKARDKRAEKVRAAELKNQ